MKLFKRSLLAILLVMIVGLALFVPPVGGLGAGYYAKLMCSGVFVSDRPEATVLAEDLSLDNPLSSLVTTTVDQDQREATGSFLGVIKRTAVFRPGLGCALTVNTPDETVRSHRPQVSAAPRPAVLPVGSEVVDSTGVARVLAESLADEVIRTRAVVVLHRGAIVGEAYGAGWDATMPLQAWSMTKSITAMLVGQRIEEGALAVSDPAPIAAWQDERAGITVEHLLRMSSGLEFEEFYALPTADAPQSLFNRPASGAYAASKPLEHEPGSHWAYSSGTTNILQEILRGTFDSDADYWAYPAARLFYPIGATSAVIETDASGTFVGSSFMYATARDWARFGQLLLQDGVWEGTRVLPEGWVSYMTTPAPAAPLGRYGAQTWLNAGEPGNPANRAWPSLPRDTFWFSGYDGQYVVIVPSHEAVIVRLGLTQNESLWDEEAFFRQVLAQLPEQE